MANQAGVFFMDKIFGGPKLETLEIHEVSSKNFTYKAKKNSSKKKLVAFFFWHRVSEVSFGYSLPLEIRPFAPKKERDCLPTIIFDQKVSGIPRKKRIMTLININRPKFSPTPCYLLGPEFVSHPTTLKMPRDLGRK